MDWKPSDIEDFFGVPLEAGLHQDPPQLWFVRYQGPLLQYMLSIDEAEDHVSLSGDPTQPFGPDSLFEIVVPCTIIRPFPDPYRPGTALRFFVGDNPDPDNLVLDILKGPEGELKCWSSDPELVRRVREIADSHRSD